MYNFLQPKMTFLVTESPFFIFLYYIILYNLGFIKNLINQKMCR